MLKNENNFWNAPLTLSISSDRAGGTFKMCDADSDTMKSGKWAIWFKPMDMLKVNLGTIDKSMNTESIDWGGRVLNYDSFGASLDVNVDAFSATLAVVPGKAAWWFDNGMAALKDDVIKAAKELAGYDSMSDDDKKAFDEGFANASGSDIKDMAEALKIEQNANFKTLNLYAQYAADFGTISAMLDFSENFKKTSIAAGYKNTFGVQAGISSAHAHCYGDADVPMVTAFLNDSSVLRDN